MPYIKKDQRQYFQVPIEILDSLNNPGQLNYIFTQLAIAYIKHNGECYQTYNDLMGAAECFQFEIYRRKIGDYEDIKVRENGDVF